MRPVDADDQAAGLRRLLGDRSAVRGIGFFGPDAGLNALAGANLAFALAHRGGDVCVLDEAPGPRNVAGQFGLTPRVGLAEVLRGQCGLEEAMTAGPGGIRLLRVEQGLPRAAETDERTWAGLGEDFAREPWEWLFLAAPADGRVAFAMAAPRRVLVMPAVRGRLPESYAILKGVQQVQPDGQWLVLVMNATDEETAARLAAALDETARRFLGIELGYLGAVPRDAKLDMTARAMRPVLELDPGSPAAHSFRARADAMHAWPPLSAGMDARAFWLRLGLFARLNGRIPTLQQRLMRHGRAYG